MLGASSQVNAQRDRIRRPAPAPRSAECGEVLASLRAAIWFRGEPDRKLIEPLACVYSPRMLHCNVRVP